jgi:glycosyltransferase involved in cell wall biosynthesis
LLNLIHALDRTRYRPVVVFAQQHALLDEFRAVAETHIRPRTPGFEQFVWRVLTSIVFLLKHRIGLVHLNNSITRQQEWMLAAWLTRTPYIVHERGFNAHYTRLDRFCAARARMIIAVSSAIMGHLFERAIGIPSANLFAKDRNIAPRYEDARIFYDGLDPDRVQVTRSPAEIRALLHIPDDHTIIGIVGNIREWKGQEVVMDALPDILAAHPKTTCLFVGAQTAEDDPYNSRLDTIARTHGMTDRIRFTGYQPDPASFMHAMSVVMHASILPEPFGMVVLEAMALKKPVVASRSGGPMETVLEHETGELFYAGNAKALAAHVIGLLDDPVKAATMGEAGYRRLLHRFSIPRYMQEIHKTYACIVANEPVPIDLGVRNYGHWDTLKRHAGL